MHAEYDCPWQSASGAQSGTSPFMMISKRYQINSVSEKRERRGNVNTGGPVFAKSREERDYGRSKIYGRKEA